MTTDRLREILKELEAAAEALPNVNSVETGPSERTSWYCSKIGGTSVSIREVRSIIGLYVSRLDREAKERNRS